MKAKELRAKSDGELAAMAERFRREIYHLRVQTVTSQLKDATQFRKVRRDIARIETVRTERRLSVGAAGATGGSP